VTAPQATGRAPGQTFETGWLVRRFTLTDVGLVGVTAALTIMFFAMRAVMDIGGSCASGNTPYQIARPCPDGVGGLMTGSILLGLVFLAVYGISAIGPNLTLLAWPALFLSLGWNFLEYGVNPPDGSTGVVWGWLICGVVFALMGGLPLVFGIKAALAGNETRAGKARTSMVNRYSSASIDRVDDRTLWRIGLVAQLVSIVVGIWVGIQIYEWGSGTTVSISWG
jgi:hypothetical protein